MSVWHFEFPRSSNGQNDCKRLCQRMQILKQPARMMLVLIDLTVRREIHQEMLAKMEACKLEAEMTNRIQR
jgi:hypothetical protein